MLSGSGSLLAGAPVALQFSNALPASTAVLVTGFSILEAPFKGGTLVPTPSIIQGALPTLDGASGLAATWPAGIAVAKGNQMNCRLGLVAVVLGGLALPAHAQGFVESSTSGLWYGKAFGATWTETRDMAESWGGHLATIHSQDLHDSFAADLYGLLQFGQKAAIGLYQDPTDPAFSEPGGGWKWHSGEPVTFAQWLRGEPNAGGSLGYLFLPYPAPPSDAGWVAGGDDPGDPTLFFGFVELYSDDCDENNVPDKYEIAVGLSPDTNSNGIPDHCEVDCNGNGVPDILDLQGGTSLDCNLNDIPDECDITAGGESLDLNNNGIPDECDVGQWDDLGFALAGSAGEPALAGTGSLAPNAPTALMLTDARPFASATLIVGFSAVSAPFKGGVLVPNINIVFNLTTDFFGAVTFAGPFPAGVPQGFVTYFQFWIQDPVGPAGFAASNALAATAP